MNINITEFQVIIFINFCFLVFLAVFVFYFQRIFKMLASDNTGASHEAQAPSRADKKKLAITAKIAELEKRVLELK